MVNKDIRKVLTDLVKLGKKKGINDAVTYLPLDSTKNMGRNY